MPSAHACARAWTSARTGDQFDIYYTISEIITISGDIDGDGDVDPGDFYIFSANYGKTI